MISRYFLTNICFHRITIRNRLVKKVCTYVCTDISTYIIVDSRYDIDILFILIFIIPSAGYDPYTYQDI